MRYLLILAATLAACGYPGDTKGSVSEAIARAHCGRKVECGWLDASQEEACVTHEYIHACVLDDSCHKLMPEIADGILEKCLQAYEDLTCPEVYFLHDDVPQACIPIR